MAKEMHKGLRNLKKVDEETLHGMIAKKAYELYEERGKEHGKDLDDWLEAEKIVNGRKRKK